jgi:hypothetical protein
MASPSRYDQLKTPPGTRLKVPASQYSQVPSPPEVNLSFELSDKSQLTTNETLLNDCKNITRQFMDLSAITNKDSIKNAIKRIYNNLIEVRVNLIIRDSDNYNIFFQNYKEFLDVLLDTRTTVLFQEKYTDIKTQEIGWLNSIYDTLMEFLSFKNYNNNNNYVDYTKLFTESQYYELITYTASTLCFIRVNSASNTDVTSTSLDKLIQKLNNIITTKPSRIIDAKFIHNAITGLNQIKTEWEQKNQNVSMEINESVNINEIVIMLDRVKINAQVVDQAHDFCETNMICSNWSNVVQLFYNCHNTVTQQNQPLGFTVQPISSVNSFIETSRKYAYGQMYQNNQTCFLQVDGENSLSKASDFGLVDHNDTEVSETVLPFPTINLMRVMGLHCKEDMDITGIVYDATKKTPGALVQILADATGNRINSHKLFNIFGLASEFDSASGTFKGMNQAVEEYHNEKISAIRTVAKREFVARFNNESSEEVYKLVLKPSQDADIDITNKRTFLEFIKTTLEYISTIKESAASRVLTNDEFMNKVYDYIISLSIPENSNNYQLFHILTDVVPCNEVDDINIILNNNEKEDILEKLNIIKQKFGLNINQNKINFNKIDLSPKDYLEYMFMNKNGKQLPVTYLANKCFQVPVDLIKQLLFRVVIFSGIYNLKPPIGIVQNNDSYELSDLNFLSFLENINEAIQTLATKLHPTLEIYNGNDLKMTHDTSSVTSISRKMRNLLCKTWLSATEYTNYSKLDDKEDTSYGAAEDDDEVETKRSTGISSKIDIFTAKALTSYLTKKQENKSADRDTIKTFEEQMFYTSLGKTASDLLQGLLTKFINDKYPYFPLETLTMDQQFALICSLEDIPVLFEIPRSGARAAMQIFPGSLLPKNVMQQIVSDTTETTLGIISDNVCKEKNVLFMVAKHQQGEFLDKIKKPTPLLMPSPGGDSPTISPNEYRSTSPTPSGTRSAEGTPSKASRIDGKGSALDSTKGGASRKRKHVTIRNKQSNPSKHSIRHKQKQRRQRTRKHKNPNDDLYDNLLVLR